MVIGDLIKINNMYQFSLASFIKLFKRALETKPQASSIEEKLNYLSNSLIKLSFSEIGRSLFKADRLTYSLHFIKGVYPQLFGKNEFEFFSGTILVTSEAHMQLPKWATKDRKEIFSMFVNTFSHIVPNMQFDNDGIWTQFMKSNQPEKEFPQQVATRVTPFQRCIIIQIFRPDRLESAMHQFVKEAFGG
jgi:dynein heavy chain 2